MRWLLLCMVLWAPITWADCVVLMHGLARTEAAMEKLEIALKKAGFNVVNHSYPSREHTISKLANYVETFVKQCPANSTVHFVTHSMGGILVRYYLKGHTMDNLGRVVMLGPPNSGSEVVDKLGEFPGFHFLNGDAGLQLGTGPDSVPSQLGPVAFEVGIVAGTRTINLVLSQLIPGPDDGKVSVVSTKVSGMKDHITLPVTHTFMMRNDMVIAQVLYFLRHGIFERSAKASAE